MSDDLDAKKHLKRDDETIYGSPTPSVFVLIERGDLHLLRRYFVPTSQFTIRPTHTVSLYFVRKISVQMGLYDDIKINKLLLSSIVMDTN